MKNKRFLFYYLGGALCLLLFGLILSRKFVEFNILIDLISHETNPWKQLAWVTAGVLLISPFMLLAIMLMFWTVDAIRPGSPEIEGPDRSTVFTRWYLKIFVTLAVLCAGLFIYAYLFIPNL